MKTTVYRYVKLASLSRIRQEGLFPSDKNAKVFNGAILQEETAVYALTAPEPPEWTRNSRFPGAWSRLKLQLTPSSSAFNPRGGNLLLAIDVDTATDRIRVVDWGPMEEHVHRHAQILDEIRSAQARRDSSLERHLEFQSRQSIREAHKFRQESTMTLEDYMLQVEQGQAPQQLPEVHILSRIPPERIRVAHEQPLLVESLEVSRRSSRATLLSDVEFLMKRDPEVANSRDLQTWFSRNANKGWRS